MNEKKFVNHNGFVKLKGYYCKPHYFGLDNDGNITHDNEKVDIDKTIKVYTDKFEELVTRCKQLQKERDYWKAKYDEGTKTFEIPDYYKIPTSCDDCTFLGNNGICGYCKFTCECYDGKGDLVDGNVLPNCPFHRNDRLLEKCRDKYRRLDLELLQKIRQVGDLLKRIKQLEKENEEFREEINAKNCHKCMNYCQDKASDYCLVDEREPTYFPFPFGWNYKTEAEKCQYYER